MVKPEPSTVARAASLVVFFLWRATLNTGAIILTILFHFGQIIRWDLKGFWVPKRNISSLAQKWKVLYTTHIIFLYKPKFSARDFRIFPTLNTPIMKLNAVVICFKRSHNFSRKSGFKGGIRTHMKGFAIESCLLCDVKLIFQNSIN